MKVSITKAPDADIAFLNKIEPSLPQLAPELSIERIGPKHYQARYSTWPKGARLIAESLSELLCTLKSLRV